MPIGITPGNISASATATVYYSCCLSGSISQRAVNPEGMFSKDLDFDWIFKATMIGCVGKDKSNVSDFRNNFSAFLPCHFYLRECIANGFLGLAESAQKDLCMGSKPLESVNCISLV